MPRHFNGELLPIRVLREILGYSQSRFAMLIGISPETVKSLELGRLKLSAANRRKIHRATGVREDSLEKLILFSKEFPYTEDKESRQKIIAELLACSRKASLVTLGGQPYTRAYFETWQRIQRENAEHFQVRMQHETDEAVLRVRALLESAAGQATKPQIFANLYDDLNEWLEATRQRYSLEKASLKRLFILSKGKRKEWSNVAPPGHSVIYEAGKKHFVKLGKDGVPLRYESRLPSVVRRKRTKAP